MWYIKEENEKRSFNNFQLSSAQNWYLKDYKTYTNISIISLMIFRGTKLKQLLSHNNNINFDNKI